MATEKHEKTEATSSLLQRKQLLSLHFVLFVVISDPLVLSVELSVGQRGFILQLTPPKAVIGAEPRPGSAPIGQHPPMDAVNTLLMLHKTPADSRWSCTFILVFKFSLFPTSALKLQRTCAISIKETLKAYFS